MSRNIKISEEQYKMLQEANEDMFPYVTDSDFKPFDGYGNITADGKKDGVTPADKNTTSDDHAAKLTMQGWNRYRTYGNIYPTTMREGVDIDQKKDFYDTKGFNNAELNTLTDDDETDNLVKIPQGIENKLNILLDSIKQSNLSPKQQAIVLNKIIEELDYDSIPNQWKKELINDLK
jgi:hypothetical protein